MMGLRSLTMAWLVMILPSAAALAQDIAGAKDHPAISRYPGSVIAWQQIENHMPYRIAVGPETGYRKIDKWVETEGRVTRLYYRFTGQRTHSEVWRNYRDALAKAGFEILVEGVSPKRQTDPAGRSWSQTVFAANPWGAGGAVGEMTSGTSTSGARGTVAARKQRAEGALLVDIHVYQFRADQVSTLINIVEEAKVVSGLVIANAEAIGRGIADHGRVVLNGLMFDHDRATLTPASAPAMEEIVKFLKMKAALKFYVVGHTDSTGRFEYNRNLSSARAAAVVEALTGRYGIARDRLEAHGVGPLNPVFTNASDAGREQNRRVELVER